MESERVFQNSPGLRPESFTMSQRMIYVLLPLCSGLTQGVEIHNYLTELFGQEEMSLSNVYLYLEGAKEQGYVTRTGQRKSYVFELSDKGVEYMRQAGEHSKSLAALIEIEQIGTVLDNII